MVVNCRKVWQVRTVDALVTQEGGPEPEKKERELVLLTASTDLVGPSEARSPDCQSLPTGTWE